MSVKIGIDFGGTKTEIIALDGHNGKELYRKRIPTEKEDYQKLVKSLQGLVEEAESTLGTQASIGIGIPGSISKDNGLVKNSNTICMNGKPLKKDLEEVLGRDVRIQNDANCFAVSEAVDGAGQGASVVFGVIIGTGCGGGVVIDRKPIDGINGIAGQWGHNPLPYPRVHSKDLKKYLSAFEKQNLSSFIKGKEITYFEDNKKWNEYPGVLCHCGHQGCLETWISGTGFKLDYQRVEGEDLSTHDIIANAKQGDPKAVFALGRYVDRLARALSVVMNILDPDVIVLGGGMSNVLELYESVPKVWGRYVNSDIIHTKLVPPRHGDSSGVRGAAHLW